MWFTRVMFLFLDCSAALPHSYDHASLWTEKVGNFNSIEESLYPLIGLRNKAAIHTLFFRNHLLIWYFESFIIKKQDKHYAYIT